MKRIALLITALLSLAVFAYAEGKTKMCGKMEGKEKCSMHDVCGMKGADMKVTNTDKGVTIEVTGADKETIKKIQEHAKKMQKCHAGMKADKSAAAKEGDEMVTCPVMGTKMAKSKAFAVREYKGKKYYLCCEPCVGKFDKDPAKYAK
jgi:YHS domain-containing protein